MDIINWLYLIKNKFTKTTPLGNDLIMLGSNVGFKKRGDKFQDYTITVNDFAAATKAAIDVDYSTMYTMSSTGTLSPGQWYRVTDYKSVNFLNGWATANNNLTPTDPNFNPREIYTGEVEPLLVQAITPYEVSPIGYSETHPGDIIQYAPYTNKIGLNLDIANGNTLPNLTTVSGFDLQWDGANVYFNMPQGYPALLGHFFYLYAEFTGDITGGGAISSYYDNLMVLPSGNLNGFTGASDLPVQGTFPSPLFEVPFTTNGNGVLIGNLTINVYSLGSLFQVTASDPLTLAFNTGYGFSVGDELYFSFGGHDYTLVLDSSMIAANNGSFYVNNYTTSGDGQNAEFFVIINNAPIKPNYSLSVNDPGEFFVPGDLVTINGSELLGITGVNNLTFNVDATPLISENYYQDGAYEPLTPGIAYCQYPYTSDDPNYLYPKAMSRIKVENNGYKVILLDLTETDYNNYDQDTLYVETIYELGDAYGWITRRQDTQRVIDAPFDFRGIRYRRFQVDLSPINTSLGTNYYGIGDNYLGQGTTGNFKDFKVFGNDGYDAYNIKWVDLGGPDAWWYNGYSENNVFLDYCFNNTIGGSTFNNTMGSFRNSTISFYFYNNAIANEFDSNIIDQFFSTNIIGSFFSNNKIAVSFQNNNINSDFRNNTIGINFYTNTIGTNFSQNTTGSDFYYNTIGDYFRSNVINNSFVFNTVGSDFKNNSIASGAAQYTNFTSSTYVYGNYDTALFRRSDGSPQLSYVDGTNTVQYAAITA